jgi:signal transduction histidine kinase
VQESLTNIHRHSQSPSANIALGLEGGELRLEIADQGRGMPPGALHRTNGSAGVGVAGMRERVRKLGGRFEIESGGAGTTVRMVLPIASLAESA